MSGKWELEKFLERRKKTQNLRFDEFVALLEFYGGKKCKDSGSHVIFKFDGDPGFALSIQSVRGMAKPYQVRQFWISWIASREGIEMMDKGLDRYSVVVQWSVEDEGCIAIVPELPGLSAFGETAGEALRGMEIAKALFLEVCQEDGRSLPEPDVVHEFSGQTRVRMPRGLHRDLSLKAKRDGVSLNTYIVSLLSSNHVARLFEEKAAARTSTWQGVVSQSGGLGDSAPGSERQ